MFLMRSEYDHGVNTFSPEGRLFQVEYAIEAIKLGSTAVGIQTKEGVVLGCEKRLTSTLMDPKSIEKIMEIDNHVGCAMSGLIADARNMVDHARVESQYHKFTYNEPMYVESITQSVCDLALKFGEGDDDNDDDNDKGLSRPFGVALLIGGIDENGPSLYHTDPSGTFVKYKAKAIGAGSEGAQTTIQDEWNDDMTLKQAEDLCMKILKQVMEEKVTSSNVEFASITVKNPVFTFYNKKQLETIMKRSNTNSNQIQQ